MEEEMKETVPEETTEGKGKKKKAPSAVAKAQQEAAEYKDQLLRTMAEFDNFRKRTAKEKAGTFEDARIKTLMPFVQVLDNFERAASADCADASYKEGVMLLLEQFEAILKEQGVTEIDCLGQVLDPTCQQAVMQEAAEGIESGCVTRVFQKGYKLGDRVLRNAMVAVAP